MIPAIIPFIGRDSELSEVKYAIEYGSPKSIILIGGDGGIGKTKFIKKLYDEITSDKQDVTKFVLKMIDFDQMKFRNVKNIINFLIENIGKENFFDFTELEDKLKQYTFINYDERTTKSLKNEMNKTFGKCITNAIKNKRLIGFFDTSDQLRIDLEMWRDLYEKMYYLDKAVFIIAGRNVKIINRLLKQRLENYSFNLIELKPFNEEDSKNYLSEIKNEKDVSIRPSLEENIIFLSEGIPIYLDLAVDLRGEGINLEWMDVEPIEKLKSLPSKDLKEKKDEFRRELVVSLKDIKNNLEDILFLLSHVFPLNSELLKRTIPDCEDYLEIMEIISKYSFIKIHRQMHNSSDEISLHDVMRALIYEHLGAVIDYSKDTRKAYSREAILFFEEQLQDIEDRLEQIEAEESLLELNNNTVSNETVSLKVELEQELWILRERLMVHTLMFDVDQGINTFFYFFDMAWKKRNFWVIDRLLLRVTYPNANEPRKKLIFTENSHIQGLLFRKIKYFYGIGKYKKVIENGEKIFSSTGDDDLIAYIYIFLGNAHIRLGDSDTSDSAPITIAKEYFKKAVELSEESENSTLYIKAINALGYSYRLLGEYNKATLLYEKAKALCRDKDYVDSDEIAEEYAWVLNNLAYILSLERDMKLLKKSRHIADEAINQWKRVDNDVGLGAAYLVIHYRTLFITS